MLFRALALLQVQVCRGAQDGEEKGRDRLIIESGVMVSDKRQKRMFVHRVIKPRDAE